MVFHDEPKSELSMNLLPTFVNLWVAKGSSKVHMHFSKCEVKRSVGIYSYAS
jgi:hypothetical protein